MDRIERLLTKIKDQRESVKKIDIDKGDLNVEVSRLIVTKIEVLREIEKIFEVLNLTIDISETKMKTNTIKVLIGGAEVKKIEIVVVEAKHQQV